jgi:hypothetical protein
MENKNNSRRSFLRSAAKGAVVAVVTPTAFAMGEPANTIHSSIIGANTRIILSSGDLSSWLVATHDSISGSFYGRNSFQQLCMRETLHMRGRRMVPPDVIAIAG